MYVRTPKKVILFERTRFTKKKHCDNTFQLNLIYRKWKRRWHVHFVTEGNGYPMTKSPFRILITKDEYCVYTSKEELNKPKKERELFEFRWLKQVKNTQLAKSTKNVKMTHLDPVFKQYKSQLRNGVNFRCLSMDSTNIQTTNTTRKYDFIQETLREHHLYWSISKWKSKN